MAQAIFYQIVSLRIHICSVFVFLLMSHGAYSQTDNTKKLSRLKVSADLHARLIERFNLFVEYEQSQEYEKQFDLHPPGHPVYHIDNPNRESYASFKRELAERDGKLVELIVRQVDKKPDKRNTVSISVSVKLQRGGKVYKDEPIPIMIAFLRDGEWYFTLTYFYV